MDHAVATLLTHIKLQKYSIQDSFWPAGFHLYHQPVVSSTCGLSWDWETSKHVLMYMHTHTHTYILDMHRHSHTFTHYYTF